MATVDISKLPKPLWEAADLRWTPSGWLLRVPLSGGITERARLALEVELALYLSPEPHGYSVGVPRDDNDVVIMIAGIDLEADVPSKVAGEVNALTEQAWVKLHEVFDAEEAPKAAWNQFFANPQI